MDGPSPGYTQQRRLLKLSTPLGEDVLLPIRFAGREAVGGPFAFEVTARAKRDDVAPKEIVGHLVDLGLEIDQDGLYRSWNALCVGLAEEAPVTRGLRLYRLILKPQTFLLTQKSDCRIWMDQTTLDVARTLLSEHGLPAPDASGVTNPPAPQHYSVQWNETDYDYLMRRLEEDGLFHWYVHEKGRHVLTLGDHASAWREAQEPRVRFSRGSTDRNHIFEWTRTFSFMPGKRAGRDWNFETPTTVPEGRTPSLVDLPAHVPYELYEYPARAMTHQANEEASKLRMQASEGDFEGSEGRSTARGLAPGFRVTPYDVARPDDVFEEQVVVEIAHEGQDESYETGANDPFYTNSFRTIAARTPLTPHRRTRRPRIDGTQIAIVAGPSGEEIHTEQYGRIKLWFPWDRRAKKDGTDTCWVRVGQSWGGGQWGQQIIPRIGMEVAVTYLDGDPDRPMVVGVVPNPKNYVPYDLPGHKTKSVLRSNTHKGTGYNEVSMEDQAGRENIFTHAQKYQTTKVLHNQTSRIDANALHSVGSNHSLEIGANMSKQVGGGLNMVIGAVGGMANLIAGGVIGALSQLSGSLLDQALGAATAAAGAQPSSADRNQGNAALALGETAGAGAGAGATADFAGAIGSAALLGAGALGAMSGSLDAARGGVNGATADDMRSNGGASMAAGGEGLAAQVASMIGPGIFNTLVSTMQNTSVGVAKTEQVGVAKVVTVGQVYNQSVGDAKNVMIGKQLYVGVGGGKDEQGNETPPKSILIMKDDGTILLKGVRIYIDGESHVQVASAMIDHN